MTPVLFATSDLVGARLIRAVTWSDWSHVALIDAGRGTVIEAVWPEVREMPLAAVIDRHPQHAVQGLPGDAARVLECARRQLGRPYDLRGMLGLGLHRDWQDQSAWWCSELVAWSFAAAGSPLFRAAALHRVTPQHLWMLAPGAGGVAALAVA